MESNFSFISIIFDFFYWDSAHKMLNDNYEVWSYQDTMKQRMKSF